MHKNLSTCRFSTVLIEQEVKKNGNQKGNLYYIPVEHTSLGFIDTHTNL